MKKIIIFLLVVGALAAGAYYAWKAGYLNRFLEKGEKQESPAAAEAETPKAGKDAGKTLAGEANLIAEEIKTTPAEVKETALVEEDEVTSEEKTKIVIGSGVTGKMGADPNDDGVYRDEEGVAYPQEEQKLLAAIDKAADSDDFATLRKLSSQIASSKNKELKEKTIRALGTSGSSSLAEMTAFLSDSDSEIAELAGEEWLSALQEIENDSEKASVIELALKALSDKDMLENIANELIGIDEQAAISVISDIIESNSSATPYAKESYETITGEEWSGKASADAWLQENYIPSVEIDE